MPLTLRSNHLRGFHRRAALARPLLGLRFASPAANPQRVVLEIWTCGHRPDSSPRPMPDVAFQLAIGQRFIAAPSWPSGMLMLRLIIQAMLPETIAMPRIPAPQPHIASAWRRDRRDRRVQDTCRSRNVDGRNRSCGRFLVVDVFVGSRISPLPSPIHQFVEASPFCHHLHTLRPILLDRHITLMPSSRPEQVAGAVSKVIICAAESAERASFVSLPPRPLSAIPASAPSTMHALIDRA